MNILLDAYFDHNFGDDLFITILTQRYPQHRFFAFIGGCAESVQRWADNLPNLVVLPYCETIINSNMFDAYLMIGGDVIPDGGDYTGGYERRLGYMRAVKQAGGWVGMIGFNLYDHYQQKTYLDICEMVRLADSVVPRDQRSYEYLRAICRSDEKIQMGVDMAFNFEPYVSHVKVNSEMLGISVRRKLADSDESYQRYIRNTVAIADAWLQAHPMGSIRYLAMSYGTSVDEDVAHEMVQQMKEPQRAEVCVYAGQLNDYICRIQECGGVVTTRFHALIMAAMLEKPLAVIPYEVKVRHFIDEIQYQGAVVPYGAEAADTAEVLKSLEEPRYSLDIVKQFVSRAGTLFSAFDEWCRAEGNAEKRKGYLSAMPVQCGQKEKTNALSTANAALQERIEQMQTQQAQMVEDYEAEIANLHHSLEEKTADLNAVRQEQLSSLNAENLELRRQIQQIQSLAQSALNQGRALAGIRSFKLTHLLSRIRNQFCYGDTNSRRAFVKWLGDHISGRTKQAGADTSYSPIYQLLDLLEMICKQSAVPAFAPVQSIPLNIEKAPVCVQEDRPFLHEAYSRYDVIIFSVIDYTFRYQRPQQIADHFVREGHRVFYINANFSKTGEYSIAQKDGLYQVTLSSAANNAVYSLNRPEDCQEIYGQLEQLLKDYGIRDAVMIADYPTWIESIDRMKEKFGFRLVTDYMDDFTGFVTTTEAFLKDDCIRLLQLSDAVVASSQFLVNVAERYNQHVFAIRNGTEYAHFNKVFGQTKNKERKVIGYYGAIAEWFDAGKIEYLARRFQNCDIVLIGAVTNARIQELELPNVKKLGEIPYRELPEYIADFDVCLIPFDTTTDLIKATNPVKFYEYLSAGKKIVATEIPELEPYRNKYVYLANDNAKFGDYVEKCLYGRDRLAQPKACAAFARENDWSERVWAFEKVVEGLFPRVSIIVLCYNQLSYTRQCVESILKNTAYPNYELILVDNNSTDDTAAYLREIEVGNVNIRCILNKTNRGFAGGNNDGIDASTGEYIVLLNNDTLVTRGWMTSMVKHCSRGNVGIVGAVTNSIGNEAQIEVGYSDVENMPAFAYDYTSKHMNETYPHDGILAMFCVMFSRRLVDKIGKLDENYGIGMFEDDDYSFAAKAAGFELILPEDVFIHHFGSVSFKKLQDETHRKLFEKNKAYFEKKWNTTWKIHHYRGAR